jgi:hypothetical protein
MTEYTSRIRKIGVINSGMFDTLTLNFDVQAIHLVGANNVGKTSLIALIQFLFFPTINEMTFIKSAGETMRFYFRPEGSYLLFEVRTITGSIRTIGIYGTGESDARVNFVFNGPFAIGDFLDADRCPKPLQEAQAAFFSRDFARFDRFERYEEALLGLHTRGAYNVPMFALSKTNFRLLRKLMQGLLRLDRIDAADVQQFLIRIVEKGAVRTRFNLLQDFEQKYRHINQLRVALHELEALKPVMARYQRIVARIAEMAAAREQLAERLYHLSCRYRSLLEAEKERLAHTFTAQNDQLSAFDQSIAKWVGRISTVEAEAAALETQRSRFAALREATRPHTEALVKSARDASAHARVELHNALAASRPQHVGRLKRQLGALQRERDNVGRQLETRTVGRLWDAAGFDDDHRALLTFLIANDLASLDASLAVADEAAFIAASRQVIDHLDADGTFTGFGLRVARPVWYVAEADQEPLEARQARLEREIANVRRAIDVAENTETQRRALADLDAAIAAKDDLLSQFAALRQMMTQWRDAGALEAALGRHTRELERLQQAVGRKQAQREALRQEQFGTHGALQAIQERWRRVDDAHARLKEYATEPPAILDGLSLDALNSEYEQVRSAFDQRAGALERLEKELIEPKADLEARYERAGAEIPFERWLALKSNLADEIGGLEAQLQREYDGIFTVVRAKLSKITQAYENVEAQVAALNAAIRNVHISNIDQIGVAIEPTALLDAIGQSTPGQMDLFATRDQTTSLAQAHQQVEDYFNQIKTYGNEINLKDMFRLKFSVVFNYQRKPVERYEIHRFESNGTETGVKIVIYLGLIGLLQERKNAVGTRIPFFLDEVGSIDADNLNQLIAYCTRNNFLPIFASPEIRKDISHNYLFRRNGSRSYLASVVKITKKRAPAPDRPAAGETV